jgi:hypothetical protein
MRESWAHAPVIVIPPPPRLSCPHCDRLGHMIVRSVAGGDGSQTRRCVCRHCSGRFLVVIDPDLTEPIASDWQ